MIDLTLSIFRNRLVSRHAPATLSVLLGFYTFLVVAVAPAHGSFGIVSFRTAALERDGTIDVRAGSHPYEYKVELRFNENAKHELEGGLRDAIVDLPRGFVGDPLAVPRCSRQQFEGAEPFCPGNTQVGIVKADVGGGEIEAPVFNLVPPPGVPARLGFSAAGLNGLQDASVRTGAGYGVRVSTSNIPTGNISSATETIWGVPPDDGHDAERHCVVEEGNGQKAVVHGCSSDAAPKPFLTLPGACEGPLATTLSADPTEAPGDFVTAEAFSLDAGGNPIGLFGCESLPFAPTIEAAPDANTAASASGLRFRLRLPQNEEPAGLATADLKSAVVTLPPGMTPNPSLAGGLAACSPSQIALTSPAPAVCPPASKVGNVRIETPLLDHPLAGSVYLAQPYDNPFGTPAHPGGSLLALYIAVYDPVSGVVVKIPGRVEIGGGEDEGAGLVTGQLRAVFRENPELPFEELELEVFGGKRAALVTPPGCGTFTVTTDLTPWSSPAGPDATPPSGFALDSGCGAPGFAPGFSAGVLTPQAGAFSPFVTTLSRHDGEQLFQGLEETLPPGLLAAIKNVSLCPEAQANSGACDAASQIGEVSAAAGEGDEPFWVTGGRVYLTGPYAGGPGPFGLSIVVPAVAGPFDLGSVVVRARIEIDPRTAQATVKTIDPIPTSLRGVPLYIRTIQARIDRPGFVFNPTNCAQLHVTGKLSSPSATATLTSPFAAVNCAALPFKPSFAVSTQGKTSKANGASLTVNVAEKPGEANIQKVDLQLPLILPARLTTLQKACTAAQFEANPAGCPEGSNIGVAVAVTPVLKSPLTGPAYLVSHGGAAFPDVEFVLQGEGVTIDLDGKTDIKKGITYSRFETVPDAPITSFQTSLPEGPHSALAANGNLCKPTKTVTVRKRVTIRSHGHTKHVVKNIKQTVPQPLTIPTTLIGQNGAVISQNTKVAVTGCPKAKAPAKKARPTRKAGKK